jgi:hypothetical protein
MGLLVEIVQPNVCFACKDSTELKKLVPKPIDGKKIRTENLALLLVFVPGIA